MEPNPKVNLPTPNRKKRLLTDKQRAKGLARHGKRKEESDEAAALHAERKARGRRQRLVEEKQRTLKHVASLRRSVSSFQAKIAEQLKKLDGIDRSIEGAE